MQEDVGSGRRGGRGEISFVNQKRPGPGREHSGLSPTMSLLKERLNVAVLIGPQCREVEDHGHRGYNLHSLRVAATDDRLPLNPKAETKNK